MRAARLAPALAIALAVAAPSPARADGIALAVVAGETALYSSPFGTMEPFTTFGLQFIEIDMYDLDMLFGATYGKSWGGELSSAGSVTFDFRFRLHPTLNSYDVLFPYFLWGADYRHFWAEGAPAMEGPPEVPAVWVTRSGFGISLGGGFFILEDEFYFDFLIRGTSGLMWPEASWNAGIAMELGFGVYLD